jgi:hypothetical protein
MATSREPLTWRRALAVAASSDRAAVASGALPASTTAGAVGVSSSEGRALCAGWARAGDGASRVVASHPGALPSVVHASASTAHARMGSYLPEYMADDLVVQKHWKVSSSSPGGPAKKTTLIGEGE